MRLLSFSVGAAAGCSAPGRGPTRLDRTDRTSGPARGSGAATVPSRRAPHLPERGAEPPPRGRGGHRRRPPPWVGHRRRVLGPAATWSPRRKPAAAGASTTTVTPTTRLPCRDPPSPR